MVGLRSFLPLALCVRFPLCFIHLPIHSLQHFLCADPPPSFSPLLYLQHLSIQHFESFFRGVGLHLQHFPECAASRDL